MNKRTAAVVAGVAAGATAMYVLDPVSGRRRQNLIFGKAVHLLRQLTHFSRTAFHDAVNRASGVVARTRGRLHSKEIPDDAVLVDRIRSRMGRVVSHPHMIHVDSYRGYITLSGLILENEVMPLLAILRTVPGVRTFRNKLEAHSSREKLRSLPAVPARKGARPEPLQKNWAPAMRFGAVLIGTRLFVSGVSRIKNYWGKTLVLGGSALLLRAVTNVEAKRLVGVGDGRRPVRIHKTFNIAAPVLKIYEFWSHFENLRQIMPDLPAKWNARLTGLVPGQLIVWRSLPGSVVQNNGQVRFSRNSDGSTRVDLTFSYVPPVGMAGHAIARLFGSDPGNKLDANLRKLKNIFEIGRFEGQMLEKGRIVDVKPTDLH